MRLLLDSCICDSYIHENSLQDNFWRKGWNSGGYKGRTIIASVVYDTGSFLQVPYGHEFRVVSSDCNVIPRFFKKPTLNDIFFEEYRKRCGFGNELRFVGDRGYFDKKNKWLKIDGVLGTNYWYDYGLYDKHVVGFYNEKIFVRNSHLGYVIGINNWA